MNPFQRIFAAAKGGYQAGRDFLTGRTGDQLQAAPLKKIIAQESEREAKAAEKAAAKAEKEAAQADNAYDREQLRALSRAAKDDAAELRAEASAAKKAAKDAERQAKAEAKDLAKYRKSTAKGRGTFRMHDDSPARAPKKKTVVDANWAKGGVGSGSQTWEDFFPSR